MGNIEEKYAEALREERERRLQAKRDLGHEWDDKDRAEWDRWGREIDHRARLTVGAHVRVVRGQSTDAVGYVVGHRRGTHSVEVVLNGDGQLVSLFEPKWLVVV